MKITTSLTVVAAFLIGSSEELPPFNCKGDTQHISFNDSLVRAELKDTAAFNHYLKVLKIPAIQDMNDETYRLRSSHSFSKYSHIYTLTNSPYETSINVRQYDKKLNLHKEYSLSLSNSDWKKIKKKIEESCFWSNQINDSNWTILDGGKWVIEAYDPQARNCGRAHFRIDWSYSGAEGNFGDIARLIKSYAKEERLTLYKDD